jgi:hypothetical protein
MERSERIYFVVCAALIGFALAYALPSYAHFRNYYYDPAAHHWLWTNTPGPVPMGYYGQQLWGLSGALLSAGIASVVTRFLRPSSEKPEKMERAHLLWGAWALTALLIVVAYFTWNNWP